MSAVVHGYLIVHGIRIYFTFIVILIEIIEPRNVSNTSFVRQP